ncbi:MAG TPA: hypothetical protein VGS27_10365 [Candidatus Sulfotelmatobacter sp.]|nr:hypothetical protein [Candidatus Sulfotelmatobacter sp.]
MRKSSDLQLRRIFLLSAFAAVVPLTGCIMHAPQNNQQQKVQVAVSSTPSSPASVPVSTSTTPSTVQYTAAVSGTGNTAVTWSISAASVSSVCSASGAGLGTLSDNGNGTATYTAPTQIPISPCGIAVTATSNEDNTSSGQALVNVHVVVSVAQAPATIGQGANVQYTATVEGAPSANQGVIWSASCPNCGTQQSGGAFDPNNPGVFIAPGLTQGTTSVSTSITATSNFDSAQFGTATVTTVQTDPLGTVSNVQTVASCPADSNGGLTGGTCYSMTVSCPGVADLTTYLKVNPAPASAIGTVMFLTGSGGTELYDSNSSWAFGYQTVENVNAANYNTVQVSFGGPFVTTQPNGWLQGPGGVRRLACRFATISDWVYNNPKKINTASIATTSAPFCATGNSGGSGALAYAAIEYGLAGYGGMTAEFAMIEPTSGPPMTRLDNACVCNNNAMGNPDTCSGFGHTPMCFSPSEAAIIDPAYQTAGQSKPPTLCSDGLSGTVNTNANRFLSDSILWQPTKTLPTPKSTTIVPHFGGADTTTAVPQGETWLENFGSVINQQCTADAPHEIPSVSDGAQAIASDIIANCH